MNQWGFYFDQTRCLGCKTCTVACKEWNESLRGDQAAQGTMDETRGGRYATPVQWENGEPQNYAEFRRFDMKEDWRRVRIIEFGAVPPRVDAIALSMSCNHCAQPACIPECPVGALRKETKYGAVLVESSKCISCGACKEACPWGAPQFYAPPADFKRRDTARPRMTKCNMCLDRVRDGLKPACVASCPNRALDFGPMAELRARYPRASTTAVGVRSQDVERTQPSILFNARAPRV